MTQAEIAALAERMEELAGPDREELIYERMSQRLSAIMEAVPPINPPAQYWLDSDAGPSYCWNCVIIARGREFELGPLLTRPEWYERDKWEDAYFEGIDGGFDTSSDSSAACDICRKTLSYILTDYGVEQEMDYFRECPLVELRDEDTYALDRLALNIWEGSSRKDILGAAIVVNQAYRLLRAHLEQARDEGKASIGGA